MATSNLIIQSSPALASPAHIEAFQNVVTPHISDNLQRLSGVTGLTRYHHKKKLVGTAFTVKARPGDNLLIYKALMEMQPGHVLVVDGAGDCTNALVGELIMLYAQQRGCAGFVIDGAIRDTGAFYETDFPCYARGSSHRGPYKVGPGAMNVPVSVGGQVIHPGDIIVGDEDGVVSFPKEQADALLEAVKTTARNEEAIKAEIATGTREQKWLAKVLSAHGL
ncbi:RraA family protein [Cupriavidus sp. L7L]|uniref:RraA family protein n=1 Tax=Cupriavidus sp. L7L TaxID=2546443 RepID=UPI001055BF39|nr:RraA family protein [Cupriavidus sp. L7L]TDF63196.1 RraA family protein [Cupriavidus sp. L7L]